ncbi:DUF7691 family protein [Streptomyces sp. BA2]|uniref:DUF7691 family protein n=1 Tax=Streptomyces sp. BA2 TaxID=436595 RepID=UPI0013283311|nr:hypothetical protein [Streptomyces sp. BA2]MWA08453.1 hypothetical protein [Streptomyces sp. BA2]
MSKVINFNTADQAHVVAFVDAGGLTAQQQRTLGIIREEARAKQRDLDRQGVDWGLTVPEALEHLIAGRADSDAECAGNAYYTALQKIIDCTGSDSNTLGSYSSPSTFFGLLDKELTQAGVPRDLLPSDFLYAGPPEQIPFYIPSPVDGSPEIGRWPLAKAKPAADAYRAVLDRIDPDFRYDLNELIKELDNEDENWREMQDVDWYTQDTIFFSIVG